MTTAAEGWLAVASDTSVTPAERETGADLANHYVRLVTRPGIWRAIVKGSTIVQPAARYEPPAILLEGVGLVSRGELLTFVEEIPAPRPSIWRKIASLVEAVPEGDLARLPVDGAEHLDRYLYGRRLSGP